MNKFCFRFIVITNLLIVVKCVNHVLTECDFDKFSDGCEDPFGSYCNRTAKQCQCKPGFTIRVDNFCLPPKNFSDSCFVSEQCLATQILNIGCFIDEKEIDIQTLKLWINTDNVFKIIGACMCPPTHYLNSSKVCVAKKQVNDNCLSSQECISAHSYCDQSAKQCKCKPTFRYSVRKRKCVSQLIGESCSDSEHCVVHDPNAECRIGSCQCRPGFILSHSGRCAIVRIRGTSNHLLMMLVVVATAVVFALLSTAHRKWSSSDDLFDNSRTRMPLNNNWITRRTFPTTHNMVFPNANPNQTYPVSLSVPSLALIWPLSHPNDSDINQIYLDDGPPSYDEAISQALRQSDNNNSLTVIANDSNELNIANGSDADYTNSAIHTNNANNDNHNNCNNNNNNSSNSRIS